jgi:hypothetical protein
LLRINELSCFRIVLESENGPAKGKIWPSNEEHVLNETITLHFKITSKKVLSRVGWDDFSAFRTL